MTINQRFEKIINDNYKGNKRSFSVAVGLAPSVIENIVGKRQGNPSFEVIQKVLYANADISADWLILDIGDMYKIEVKAVNNEWLLKRFEEVIAENALLKQEVEQLKSSRGNFTDTDIYTPVKEKVGSYLAADPVKKR